MGVENCQNINMCKTMSVNGKHRQKLGNHETKYKQRNAVYVLVATHKLFIICSHVKLSDDNFKNSKNDKISAEY